MNEKNNKEKIKINSTEEFKSILLNYNIILSDILGVVWDGNKQINGTKETLNFLKRNKKSIFFVSNTPSYTQDTKLLFNKLNIKEKIDYDDIITSGDVLKKVIENNELEFKINKNPKNCYIFGKSIYTKLFENTNYKIVSNIEEADFVFVGFPQLTLNEYNKFSQEEKYKNLLFESIMYEEPYFDTLTIDVFNDKIDKIKKCNLPMVNNCADLVAMQPSKKDSTLHYVIRQGSVVKKYKELGGEVLEISKPNSIIYKHVFDLLKNKFSFKENLKILMIGDTINTDILGATNATNDLNIKIDGMLTLCGVSGKDFNKNIKNISDYCYSKKLNLNYIIDSLEIILDNSHE